VYLPDNPDNIYMTHFIIDGYNLIKQAPEYIGRKLRDGREDLVNTLQYKRPQGSLKNKVSVVFDGHSDGYCTKRIIKNYNIEIIFTEGETADDRIKRFVSKSEYPRNIVVVTDDKQLRMSVRMNGAKVLFVKDFIKPKSGRLDAVSTRIKMKLPEDEQHEITKELTEIWKND